LRFFDRPKFRSPGVARRVLSPSDSRLAATSPVASQGPDHCLIKMAHRSPVQSVGRVPRSMNQKLTARRTGRRPRPAGVLGCSDERDGRRGTTDCRPAQVGVCTSHGCRHGSAPRSERAPVAGRRSDPGARVDCLRRRPARLAAPRGSRVCAQGLRRLRTLGQAPPTDNETVKVASDGRCLKP